MRLVEDVVCNDDEGFSRLELVVSLSLVLIASGLVMHGASQAGGISTLLSCQANQRRLVEAWFLYAEDHSGYLVPNELRGAATAAGFWPWPTRLGFQPDRTESPERQHLAMVSNAISQGRLFAYVPNVNVYRCPGDLREKVLTLGNGFGVGTYSKMDGLGGPVDTGNGTLGRERTYWKIYGGLDEDTYRHVDEILDPSRNAVFVEENDPRGFNFGTWVMNPFSYEWLDPVALWHDGGATLSFVDGHVEFKRWEEQGTIEASRLGPDERFGWEASSEDRDLEWMKSVYPIYKPRKENR
jgi:prepilin-type processing-associated H-X9-DG protein